jgi:D-glycero-alpha-D-manno-heptose-7-phosphate kinase
MTTPAERYAALYPLFRAGARLADDECVVARAPMRWMLSGWRDVPRGGGGDCTNVALTARAVATVRRGAEADCLRLLAPDVGLDWRLTAADLARTPSRAEPHAVLRALLHSAGAPVGLELSCTAKGIPAAAGLGTSAALQVSLLAALAEVAGRHLAPLDLVHAARLPETYVLGLSCGLQDQGAAVHGGVANYHTHFEGGREHVEIRPVKIAPGFLDTLEAGLVVIDVGQPHSSHASHMDVFERLEARHPDSVRAFELLGEAEAGVQAALATGDLPAFAAAVALTWQAQERLHPAMVPAVMHQVHQAALPAGALAANVNGAGMGGTMSLLAPPERIGAVLRAVETVPGVRVLPCCIDRDGVQCWRVRDRGVA